MPQHIPTKVKMWYMMMYEHISWFIYVNWGNINVCDHILQYTIIYRKIYQHIWWSICFDISQYMIAYVDIPSIYIYEQRDMFIHYPIPHFYQGTTYFPSSHLLQLESDISPILFACLPTRQSPVTTSVRLRHTLLVSDIRHFVLARLYTGQIDLENPG